MPLQSWLRPLAPFFNLPMSSFSRGEYVQTNLNAQGLNILPLICFEVVFAEQLSANFHDNTDLMLTVSNDAWFGDSMAPHQHLEIARMRALETGRYLVRSTNTGVSAFIDDKGDIISTSPQFETHVLTEQVQPMSGMTFYAIFTNLPIVITSIGLLCLAFWFRRKYLHVKMTSP